MLSSDARVISVSQLNDYIKMLIDGNPVLSKVFVRGEISNLTIHSSGHIYFSLKDDKARVSAIMFKSDAVKLKFLPESGMKVILRGRVSLFQRDGVYQIYVSDIQPDGVGALYLAYEQLKRKLEAEGLFEQSIKRSVPKIPSSVGIITSPTGAAVRDIINVATRRFPSAKLILFPALVQGDGAEASLIEGIKYFSDGKLVDVIIIGRGGGSIEDLWAFNSESLARQIRSSVVPVISAVGHETDFTICDFASDLRAPTPSAAAELALPDAYQIRQELGSHALRMNAYIISRIQNLRERIKRFSEPRALSSPKGYIDERRQALIALSDELENGILTVINQRKLSLSHNAALLDAYSPLKIMSKGYFIAHGKDGIVKSVKSLSVGDILSLRAVDGNVVSEVKSIDPCEN